MQTKEYKFKESFEAWSESVNIDIDVNQIDNEFKSVMGDDITYDNPLYPFIGYQFSKDKVEYYSKKYYHHN